MGGVLDRFTGVTVANLTQANLESVVNSLSIASNERANIADAILLHQLLNARAGNPPAIIGLGGISTTTLGDPTPQILTVTANQAWDLLAITATNDDAINAVDFTLTLNDGSTTMDLVTQNIAASGSVTIDLSKYIAFPTIVTPDLQLQYSQAGDSSGVTVKTAYQVRSV